MLKNNSFIVEKVHVKGEGISGLNGNAERVTLNWD